MSLLASRTAAELIPDSAPEIVVIANPGDRRVELLQAALAGLGLPPARLVAYADLLAGRVSLADAVPPRSIVRIESPGRDFEVERALLALGAEVDDPEDAAGVYTRLSAREVRALSFDKGRILPSRQWYLGYRALLDALGPHLAGQRMMNLPAEIALMFDKSRCSALLASRDIPVPPSLGPISCYDELMGEMRRRGWKRVFVKLAHGSSASGAVAYRFGRADTRQPERHQVITTVEMVRGDGELRLYNSRRIREYASAAQIAELIDVLCRHRVHVEEWIPKASLADRACDLRIVTIAGRARHTVARLSRSPMTNLHLLNERGDVEAVRARAGQERWEAAMRACERAAGLFSSLYTGVDLLFTPDYRRHAILEMNAFGDLLPGILADGEDTYTAELRAALEGVAA
jgi:hypothetical protein